MNALAVLILLLFFILLALSLTVWATLALGTRRRAARATPDAARPAARREGVPGTGRADAGAPTPATARKARIVPTPPVAVQTALPFNEPKERPRAGALHDGVRPDGVRAEGARRDEARQERARRSANPESAPRPSDVVEQPWLRSRGVAADQRAPSDPPPARGLRLRVVDTDPEELGSSEARPSRATVTPREVERDPFDRFLDGEQRPK